MRRSSSSSTSRSSAATFEAMCCGDVDFGIADTVMREQPAQRHLSGFRVVRVGDLGQRVIVEHLTTDHGE